MANLKRAIKDSVFTYLFQQPEYLLQLYLSLHPEDTAVTETDCELITLENVLTTGIYNDLGFLVRETLIVLVEAQSTFSPNIALRLLLYVAKTYQEYVDEHEMDLYAGRAVKIPRPELYMVYTGKRKNIPAMLRLSDLYDGAGGVEVEVKVLRGSSSRDILAQYVRFCEISDEVRGEFGSGQDAIDEIFHRCESEGILAEFLTSRESEVRTIMLTLFDQEKVMRYHDINLAKEVRQAALQEGRKEGREEGREEEREIGIQKTITVLQKFSVSRDMVIQTLEEQYGLTHQEAEARTSRYWA